MITVQYKFENGLELLRLQEEFLTLDLQSHEVEDDTMDSCTLSD